MTENMEAAIIAAKEKKWLPLESNPDVVNRYLKEMGVDIESCHCHDILSVEEWALDMVPQPINAILLLYPLKDKTEQHNEEEKRRILQDGQVVSPSLYYMKQIVGNACGTVGLLHAIGNNKEKFKVKENSPLENFLSSSATISPDEIAVKLALDENLTSVHSVAAEEGQSKQQGVDEECDKHFVCFVNIDNCIYELDGRKAFPINHGDSTHETFAADACNVIKKFMERDPDELRFTLLALSSGVNTEIV